MKERRSDSLILEKLGAIQVDVAVVKTKTENMEEHLKTLNGKVVTQEGRVQANEAAINLINQNVANLQKHEEKETNFWERNWEKLFWTVFATVFTGAFGWFVTKLIQNL